MEEKLGVQFARIIASVKTFALGTAGALLLAFCLCTPIRALVVEPVRQGQEAFLIRAVFADRHLWLLSDAGELSSIEDAGKDRVPHHFSEPVLDLCVSDGHAMVLTGHEGPTWTLHQWINQAWSTVTVIPSAGDDFVSINCHGGSETVLTSHRLIAVGKDSTLHTVNLSGTLHPGRVSASLDHGSDFFVAINAGEWGGGLQRISRTTGEIVMVEKNASGERCGGPLNSACDPVNGLAAEPWNPNCLAAAVGLVHMMSTGGIVEVCGNQIRTLYTKPYTSDMWASFLKRHARPRETVAFFGLTSSGGVLWAVGVDGLYRIDRSGSATFTPLPRFRTIDGIAVSFDHPQLVLVMTSANERHSASGQVPMLVPR